MNLTIIGLDIAKSVFQVHGTDNAGKAQLKRKLRRSELIPFFDKQAACTVIIEACGAGLTQLRAELEKLRGEAAAI